MYQVSEHPTSISLTGSLDHVSVLKARVDLERAIAGYSGVGVKLDLDGLETFNSEVLSLCLCLMRYAQLKDVALKFDNPPGRLFDMARVGGMEFIFSS